MEALIFVDTSALYAVVDILNSDHNVASATWRELVEREEPLITTSYVVVELFSLVQSRLGLDAARTLERDLFPWLDIAWVDSEIHHAAVAAVFNFDRRKLSLVDCASFEVMRRRGLRTVFTLDRHFAEQGFHAVP